MALKPKLPWTYLNVFLIAFNYTLWYPEPPPPTHINIRYVYYKVLYHRIKIVVIIHINERNLILNFINGKRFLFETKSVIIDTGVCIWNGWFSYQGQDQFNFSLDPIKIRMHTSSMGIKGIIIGGVGAKASKILSKLNATTASTINSSHIYKILSTNHKSLIINTKK